MSNRLCIFVLAFMCSWHCAPKKVTQASRPSLFDEICDIESRRHGDREFEADFVHFGNEAMDRYKAQPGTVDKLLADFDGRTGICRGALLQLLLEVHQPYVIENWQSLDTRLSTDERIALATFIRGQKVTELAPLILKYLGSDSSNLKAIAASALEVMDQKALLPQLLELVDKENSGKVLEQLAASLNLDQYPETQQVMKAIADKPASEARRMALVTWSTSDLPNKRELIEQYTDDSDAEVVATANALLEKLRDKEKLSYTISAPKVVGFEPKDDAPQEIQDLLFGAILQGDLTAVDNALAKGARFHQEDAGGWTPFWTALHRSDAITLKHCIAKGAGTAQKEFGLNPLQSLVKNVWMDVEAKVSVLVEAGVDINEATDNGETALILAAFNNRVLAAQRLLDLGADANKRDNLGRTALDIARLLENDKLVEMLASATQTKK